MSINEELLASARAAGSKLDEAERQVLLGRAEYHTAIRRLHLAGGSLREIAELLNLSHQRVQQMVNGAGGTWWSKVWRARRVKRDAVCTFCGRPPSEVAALVAGPNVYICDACVEQAQNVAKDVGGQVMKLAKDGDRARCSFCGKGGREKTVVEAASAGICGECLALCCDIIATRNIPGTKPA